MDPTCAARWGAHTTGPRTIAIVVTYGDGRTEVEAFDCATETIAAVALWRIVSGCGILERLGRGRARARPQD